MPLKISDITLIGRHKTDGGYAITFKDGRIIHLHKKRTIPALLTLIKFGEGCESDLTAATRNLAELKEALRGKMPPTMFQDSYGDANKPFSELWNEEGFTFITNLPRERRSGSKKYTLRPEDHEKLFQVSKKAHRKPPSSTQQNVLLKAQRAKCNFCYADLKSASEINQNSFSKDRRRLVWDHRVPVEKDGDSDDGNYQALCFYCNKSKWQICNICPLSKSGCANCALAFPEKTAVIAPTKENFSDRALHHHFPKRK